MSVIVLSENTKDNTALNPNLVCRGCLKGSGNMKNLVEEGLDDDFFTYTEIPVS